MMNRQEPEISRSASASLPDDSPAWLERVEASRAAERATLEAILMEHLREQKRTRWAKNGFRLFIALFLAAVFWINTADQWRAVELESIPHKKHTAVVDIRGPILAGTNNSADNIIKGLTKAFENPNTAGVVLRINSPGGSPVQSGQVYDEMVLLQKRFPAIPLYAALEDLCTSGGYYIAAAAPLIYADKATLVGSIGVILQGFGFQETLNKLGIESRQITSGKNKAFLNPFGPVDEAEKSHAQKLLDSVHQQFIHAVRKGRGERLKTGQAELFEGLVWTGEEAVDLGLIDGLGSTVWIAREQVKQERIVNFTHKNDWLSRLSKEMGID
ncbi:MAG: S49 family peptidase [Magnetococcales bacterium]|nr:S49 family peptidase [Magnetococcales bacterium]